jgi:hypothetical protein
MAANVVKYGVIKKMRFYLIKAHKFLAIVPYMV